MDVVGGCCRWCQVNAHNEVGWLAGEWLSEESLLCVSGKGPSPKPDQSGGVSVTCWNTLAPPVTRLYNTFNLDCVPRWFFLFVPLGLWLRAGDTWVF
jgi:hypothetical protein